MLISHSNACIRWLTPNKMQPKFHNLQQKHYHQSLSISSEIFSRLLNSPLLPCFIPLFKTKRKMDKSLAVFNVSK